MADDSDENKIQEFYSKDLNTPGALIFTPPAGWKTADPKLFSERIKIFVVGQGQGNYPPSINLGTEPYKGTIKDYLKMVKAVNSSQGAQWKDLGMINTPAGKASLSQVDMKSEWGYVRLMHVILIKDGQVYVLTAGALKEEFPSYYNDFFNSMTSIRFNET